MNRRKHVLPAGPGEAPFTGNCAGQQAVL